MFWISTRRSWARSTLLRNSLIFEDSALRYLNNSKLAMRARISLFLRTATFQIRYTWTRTSCGISWSICCRMLLNTRLKAGKLDSIYSLMILSLFLALVTRGSAFPLTIRSICLSRSTEPKMQGKYKVPAWGWRLSEVMSRRTGVRLLVKVKQTLERHSRCTSQLKDKLSLFVTESVYLYGYGAD